MLPALTGGFFTIAPPGSPWKHWRLPKIEVTKKKKEEKSVNEEKKKRRQQRKKRESYQVSQRLKGEGEL